MDYRTKPISRKKLRQLATVMRNFFGLSPDEPFPVLNVLEMVPIKFKNCRIEVLENHNFPANVKGRCLPNEDGGYTIQIPESIYQGAYEKGIGAYLGFICHEICHVFLFKLGFTPVYERRFHDKELKPYESVEWQAKALCGEIMMPYDATAALSVRRIMMQYHVSKGFAQMRQRYH